MKIKNNIAISDSGFIFNSSNGESFSLNPIGTEILNLMKENKSFADIKIHIQAKYQVDDISFEKDYDDFLNNLKLFNLTDTEK